MAMELTPALLNRPILCIMQIIREKLFGDTDLSTAQFTGAKGYYRIEGFFNPLGTDARGWNRCYYLAGRLCDEGCPYDKRMTHAVLAYLSTNVVPVTDEATGSVSLSAGWLPEASSTSLVVNSLLIDHFSHPDAIFDAIRCVVRLPADTTMRVVRGATKPGVPSELEVTPFTELSSELTDEEYDRKMILHRQQMDKWKIDNRHFLEEHARMPSTTETEKRNKEARWNTLLKQHPKPKPPARQRFAHDPHVLGNPNHRDDQYIQQLSNGAIGVTDNDELVELLRAQPTTIQCEADDEDKEVEQHLTAHGIDPMGGMHYAFPRVMQKLTKTYEEANRASNKVRSLIKRLRHDATSVTVPVLKEAVSLLARDMRLMWRAYDRHGALPEKVNHSGFVRAWLKKRLIDVPAFVDPIFQFVSTATMDMDSAMPLIQQITQAAQTLVDQCSAAAAAAAAAAASTNVDAPAVVPVSAAPAAAPMDVDVDPPEENETQLRLQRQGGFGDEEADDDDEEEEAEDDGGEAERELQQRSNARKRALQRDEDDENSPPATRFEFARNAKRPRPNPPKQSSPLVESDNTSHCIMPIP
jgi:hypothetical protein